MKKISLFILLGICEFNNLFAQDNYSLLRNICTAIPDSVYTDLDFTNKQIKVAWSVFDTTIIKDSYCKDFNGGQSLLRDYNFEFYEAANDEWYSCGIDTTELLFKFLSTSAQLQVKLFKCDNNYIVGVSTNYPFESAEPEPHQILFYQITSKGLQDYTYKVFNNFNFKKDNYSKPTINALSEIYEVDYFKEKKTNAYLYNFILGDTIIIYDNFYDFTCCEKGMFYVDDDHLLNSLFWRLYKFKDCKLLPLGNVKKKRKAKKPLFE